jgi:ferredoxin
MKATVDHDLCIGCGVCEAVCPAVFQMNDDGLADVIVESIEEDAIDDAREAQDQCPVEAISIE